MTEWADPSAKQAWSQFAGFLHANGRRITRTRRTVLNHVFSRHDHFRAEDVTAALAAGPLRVSRGAVYQNLALMAEAGIVREIRDGGPHTRYEHAVGHQHHEHMVCDRCGGFTEFSDPHIREALEEACAQHGFVERTHGIVISGVCDHCRKDSLGS